MDAILRSVFYNVGKLLRSQKIITSTSERSLLKNLGSWLGKITLGRDKPVLQRELDMKELLFQVGAVASFELWVSCLDLEEVGDQLCKRSDQSLLQLSCERVLLI